MWWEESLAENVQFCKCQEERTGLGVGMFGCDRLAGRPHSQDLGTGGEARRHSGLNLNGVQYRLEAGRTQGRRTRLEGGAKVRSRHLSILKETGRHYQPELANIRRIFFCKCANIQGV